MTARAVFLVGFMGSGKSSLGKELARRLKWDFVDLDSRIENREGHSIPELFRSRGEPGFRLAETKALRDLTESLACDTVVALGGGTFAQPENRELLQAWRSVFLEAPLDELWSRCADHANDRPLRKDRIEFARLYQDRLPFYRQATVTVVTSGRDPASLCDEIERKLQSWGQAVDAGSSQIPSANPETGEIQ
ncbi:MAG: shikimate kinase [Terriglobales bacterium]